MKIYNHGSDYAHQSSLKRNANQPTVKSGQSQETTTTDAGNQVPRGGEGEMASGSEFPETSKQTKKKTEDGTETEQPKDLSEV